MVGRGFSAIYKALQEGPLRGWDVVFTEDLSKKYARKLEPWRVWVGPSDVIFKADSLTFEWTVSGNSVDFQGNYVDTPIVLDILKRIHNKWWTFTVGLNHQDWFLKTRILDTADSTLAWRLMNQPVYRAEH
jgi:hypothetical protein